MAINYGVWGQPDTWVTATGTTYVKGEIKTAEATHDTYSELWNDYITPLNNIDKSAYFYGVGKESIWLNPHYLAPYYDDESNVKVYERRCNETKEDKGLYFCNSSASSENFSYSRRYAPVVSVPTANNAYTTPITLDFNYHRVLCCPVIFSVPNNYSTGSFHVSGIKTYFDTDFSSYPRIVGIGYTIRCGSGGEDTRTSSTTGYFVPQFHFSFDHLPYTNENNYPFWVRENCNYVTKGSVSTGIKPQEIKVDRSRTDVTTTLGNCFERVYCVQMEGSSVPLYFYNEDDVFTNNNKVWKINTDTHTSGGYTYWNPYAYIDVADATNDEIKSYVLKQIAFLGLVFTDLNYNDNTLQTAEIGQEHIFVPVFDSYGVTTGEYKEGDQALTLPNATWTDSRSAGYDPDRTPDTGDTGYLYNGHHEGNRFSTYGTRKYALYLSDVWDVIDGINNLYLTDPDGNAKWQLDFKGSNPSDYIVGFYAFPLKIPHSENTQTFKLGPVEFDGVNVYTYSGTGSFSFGVINIPAKNNFLDFPPYTTAELYIPLCGTVDIDYPYFAGLQMEIYMYYDINTGSCSASIYRIANGEYLLYKTVNGQLGVEIPLTSLKMGNYQDSIHSLQAAQKQNEIRLAGSALSVATGAAALIAAPATGGTSLIAAAGVLGGLGTLASGIEKEKELDYQLSHTQPNVSQVSAAETQNNYCVGGLYPVLYIKRCKMIDGSSIDSYDNSEYGKTIAFACCECNTLDNFTGLTVCSSIDTSGIRNEIYIYIIRSEE